MEAEQNCHESRHFFENRSSIHEKATDMSGGCAEQDEDRREPENEGNRSCGYMPQPEPCRLTGRRCSGARHKGEVARHQRQDARRKKQDHSGYDGGENRHVGHVTDQS